MKTRFFVIIGLLFIVAGGLLAYEPLQRQFKSGSHKNIVSAEAPRPAPVPELKPEVPYIEGKPVSLEIPSLGVTLPVVDGVYDSKSQTWSLSKDKAHYALMTPLANNRDGNTFVYGHNRKGVFASLHKIAPGAELILTTDNGHRFVYAFRSEYETDPYDSSLFNYTGPAILTVQTCSGLWYQNRQLFTFDLKESA